jgi:predicted metal-binding protein
VLAKMELEQKTPDLLKDLMHGAYQAGASGIAIVATGDIVVESDLADRCREPRCENYGLSRSCPPHVAGPVAFKKELEAYSKALFFRIDVPAEILYSSDSRELFHLLHEIAAGIEKAAVARGLTRAKAYAGGSCKSIFCHDHPECQALAGPGTCRNPQSARPSMSGFGINVAELLRSAGWHAAGDATLGRPDMTAGKTTYICGLVLLY